MDEKHEEDRLLLRIQERTGLREPADARHVGRLVASVLLEQLSPHDRPWLVRLLPHSWADLPASAAAPLTQRDQLEDFYDRVAARGATAPSFAREHAQSVCSALAETWDEDERTQLKNRLPAAIAALLEPPARPAGPPAREPSVQAHERSTLAEGRPGSSQPLSEAATQREQQESVVRSDNPHGDTKLSSSAGLTQEREDDTLAKGRR